MSRRDRTIPPGLREEVGKAGIGCCAWIGCVYGPTATVVFRADGLWLRMPACEGHARVLAMSVPEGEVVHG